MRDADTADSMWKRGIAVPSSSWALVRLFWDTASSKAFDSSYSSPGVTGSRTSFAGLLKVSGIQIACGVLLACPSKT